MNKERTPKQQQELNDIADAKQTTNQHQQTKNSIQDELSLDPTRDTTVKLTNSQKQKLIKLTEPNAPYDYEAKAIEAGGECATSGPRV